MNKTAPRAGRNNHRAKPNLSFRAQNYKKMMKADTKTMFFLLFVAKNGKMIIPSTHPVMSSEAPPQPSPRGWSSFLLCLRRFDDSPSSLGRLGWGV